jgi:hypothetical protein
VLIFTTHVSLKVETPPSPNHFIPTVIFQRRVASPPSLYSQCEIITYFPPLLSPLDRPDSMPSLARDVIPRAEPESPTLSMDEQTLYEPSSPSSSARPSGELSDADHDILESEDERERLLTREEGIFRTKRVTIGKPQQERDNATKSRSKKSRKSRSKRKKGGVGGEESASLMYEMEEGIGARSGGSSETVSSAEGDGEERRSSESDERRLKGILRSRQVRHLWLCVL